ncbi:glycoside hydrolase family 3 N-terminal domain-containing protein [Streptomyces sp. RG80]|uniref:glycoside hydrolase family 3 N-terminal domain-containing protein n=1 Tax=Streptomyces sp. RG80 TaxID=3157340 RepID=UPI00338DFA6B
MNEPLYRDPAAPLDARVHDLLTRMTLREKVGQLNQRMYGWDAYRRTPDGGYELTDALYAETERFAGLGALYGLQRADAWSGVDHGDGPGAEDGAALAELVQRHVVERSRLGIPALFVEEVPHGHMALDGTVLPVNLAVGATWDPELYERAAAHAAAELRARGGHVALVSALDIARDPRWGRTEECFGEDPYLAARLTEALVWGMQGTGARFAPDKAPVVLKHFAGQGATVGGRNSAESELGRRELHEIHLPAARAGVRAGAAAVMAAYNEVDGMPCSGNRALLTELLREQWEFDGLVMADGLAVDRLARITGDKVSAGARALNSGVDLSLWDEGFTHLEEAVERGLVDEKVLDAAVARVLRLKFRLGLFDPGLFDRQATTPEFPSGGREMSTALARASVTLLHNDEGVLPVAATASRIAVLGPQSATTAHQLGDYTAPQLPGTGSSVLDALRRLAPPGVDLRHARGCALTGDDVSGIPEAVAAAAASDLAVLVLGGSSARTPDTEFDANGAALRAVSEMTCGEGVDLADLRLGPAQYRLLDAVVATGTPTAVVLVQGRPHIVPETGGALLTAWYPGPWGGEAIAEVLLGLTEPAGRLPVSVPRSAAQLPVYYNHKDTEYGGYVDESAEPLHSFGHGLSYTSFAYGTPRLTGRTVIVEVTNTGARYGRTVVQVYLRRLVTDSWPRTLELCAFEGVSLEPGECRTVALPLGEAFVEARTDSAEIRVAESARAALRAVPLVIDLRA